MRSELEGGKRDVHKAGSDFVKVDRRGKGLSHLLGCVLGGVLGRAGFARRIGPRHAGTALVAGEELAETVAAGRERRGTGNISLAQDTQSAGDKAWAVPMPSAIQWVAAEPNAFNGQGNLETVHAFRGLRSTTAVGATTRLANREEGALEVLHEGVDCRDLREIRERRRPREAGDEGAALCLAHPLQMRCRTVDGEELVELAGAAQIDPPIGLGDGLR